MRDAFIITPAELSTEALASAAKHLSYSFTSDERTIWSGQGDEHIDLTEDPDIAKYYGEAEKPAVQMHGPNERYYHLRFCNVFRAGQMILSLFGGRDDVLLDNDHGLLVPLSIFSTAFMAAPTWDWSVAEELPRAAGPNKR